MTDRQERILQAIVEEYAEVASPVGSSLLAKPWLYETAPNEPLSVYIGRENPIGRSAGASLIISRFRSPFSDRSYIGVLGPTRQSYRDVMSLVGQAGKALEETLYV
jgi:transcriptional regulator of heat shock response